MKDKDCPDDLFGVMKKAYRYDIDKIRLNLFFDGWLTKMHKIYYFDNLNL